MTKVYLAKKGDTVVHHTSLDALKSIDGIKKPDMEVSEADFEAAGGLVRLIDGKIVLRYYRNGKRKGKRRSGNHANQNRNHRS